MTEVKELTDEERIDIAQSWLVNEIRKIQSELGLTPAQMMQVSFKCFGRVMKKYLDSIEEEDES